MTDRCCESLADALQWGMLVEQDDEIALLPRSLTDINPVATAGNVLTGETYDPSGFTLTLALDFCPFCAYFIGRADQLQGPRPMVDSPTIDNWVAAGHIPVDDLSDVELDRRIDGLEEMP